ncbi:MAG: hypothetical protein [Caudoviricetes sp.]|nr:MAG: hypothetical protein [Caudoviricetes sp.]
MAIKSIPASHIVKVVPSAIGTGGSAYNLNGVFFTTSAPYPVRTYTSADTVKDDYGTDADAYKFAQVYFSKINTATKTPSTLFVVRYNALDIEAKLIGGTLKSKSLADLQAISGTLSVTVDGTAKSGSVDLSTATSWSNGAEIIGTALTEKVEFDSELQAFIVSSSTSGANSSIAFATGTAADALGLSSDGGATVDNETVKDTAESAIGRLKSYTLNFGGFTYDSTFTIDQIKALATYVLAQTHDIWFVAHALEAQALIANNSNTLGGWIKENNISDTTLIYGDITEAALALGFMASLDFTRTNGAQTLDFRNVSGLPSRVDDPAAATALESNGYMYYGGFATKVDRLIFFRNSKVSGEFEYIDDYLTQLYLNGNLQNAILNGLVATGKVPYNAEGQQIFRSWCTTVINLVANFGGIQTGIELTDSQKQQVNALANFDVATELFTKGWVLIIGNASPTVRSERGSFPATLVYTGGGSVQSINLNSVAVL